MTPPQSAIDEALAITRAFHRQPGAVSAAIQRLAGGMNNAVYRVQLADQPVCVKLYKVDERQRAEREWQALCWIGERGLGIAPQPLHFAPDAELPAVVMEFVPGVSLSDQQPGVRELAALAATLKQLYALTPQISTYPHTVIGTPLGLMQRVESWLAQLADRADEPLVAQILAVMAQWESEADRTILAMPAPLVFSRGDPNLANCLWDGQRVRCVDLEYSGWSDVAFDLADLIEAQPSRHVSDPAWERFIDLFELHDPAAQERLAAARRLCAVFWISLLWRRWERGEPVEHELAGQTRRARQRLKRATL
ncbi:MAG: phosphotransferase [Chloroflexi bacterium]|nr:phosphotransferase [Chloroflexota bacterium]